MRDVSRVKQLSHGSPRLAAPRFASNRPSAKTRSEESFRHTGKARNTCKAHHS